MDENEKKRTGNSRILAALAVVMVGSLGIAAVMMAILPAKAPAGIVPSHDILEMGYFHDLSGPERSNAPNMSDILSEYALVTVDSAAFMNDADTSHEVTFVIHGTLYRKEALYRMHLVSVPPPIAPDAVFIEKNERGETRQALPLIKQYKGSLIGKETGNAFFTVSDDVLLGRISVGDTYYFLEQRGPGRADGGKTIHILYRSDSLISRAAPRTFEPRVPEVYSLMNLDLNRSHAVHILLYNATHDPAGEEQFELATGGRYRPDLLATPCDGTYSLRFTIDGNRTSEVNLSVPSASRFQLDPEGNVIRDDMVFTG